MSATPMSGQLGSMKWRIVRSLDCGRAGGRGVSTAVQPVGELKGRGEKEAHLPQEKVTESGDARGAYQDVEGRGCRRIQVGRDRLLSDVTGRSIDERRVSRALEWRVEWKKGALW